MISSQCYSWICTALCLVCSEIDIHISDFLLAAFDFTARLSSGIDGAYFKAFINGGTSSQSIKIPQSFKALKPGSLLFNLIRKSHLNHAILPASASSWYILNT
jgi:hypothetical protein